MGDKYRILLIAAAGDDVIVPVVERYVRKHDLPWTLEAMENRPAQLPDLSRLHADAILGFVSFDLPEWWRVSPVPYLHWGNVTPAAHINYIRDDEAVGRFAAGHFHEEGIRQVATVKPWYPEVRHVRFSAFLGQAKNLGLETFRYYPPEDLTPSEADLHLMAWLRNAPHPLGVFLHQDRDALHFLRLCRRHGIKVPGHVAILGCDNLPACEISVPRLSSVSFPSQSVAATMTMELHRLLCGAPVRARRVLVAPSHVQTRQSTHLRSCGDKIINALRRRIDAKPGRIPAVPALAAAAGLSTSQLHRRFITALGISPGAYVGRRRLRMAQELLVTTDETLTEIARRCGLGTRHGLRKAFITADLPPPSTWRAMRRGEPLHTPKTEADRTE